MRPPSARSQIAGGHGASAQVATFPDGHVEEATTETDDQGRTWWRMEYTSYVGVLSRPDTNETDLDPIMVDVSLSGTAPRIELRWGLDTCAQANHGC